MTSKKPEVWLRGSVAGIAPLLQPAVHALLEAREEIDEMIKGFPAAGLWERPAGVASVGFHLQHLKGVLDRLFTYARGQSLNEDQLRYLRSEGEPASEVTPSQLFEAFSQQVDLAISQLRNTDERTLSDFRSVGRAQLPSTVMGLIFHAAEHTMRHTGQLLVTVKLIRGEDKK